MPAGHDTVVLATLENPQLAAALTTNVEPHFGHVDKSAAIAAQLLKGVFNPEEAVTGSFDERLAAEIEQRRAERAKQNLRGVFAIFEGAVEVEPNFDAYRDTENFGIAIDAFDKAAVRELFRPNQDAIISGLILSVPPGMDRKCEKLAQVVYLKDAASKVIYALSMGGGAVDAYTAGQLTDQAISDSGNLTGMLAADTVLTRSVSLLVASMEIGRDELEAFLIAWSALEIFVNASFKATYGQRWLQIMRQGAPQSAEPVFDRLADVMKDKYRLADKFLIIASVLNGVNAATDEKEFRRLKDVRDTLLHTYERTTSPLPTAGVQALTQHYLRLHLLDKAAGNAR
ncbi:MAG: hypothetical protein H0U98_08850 [Alphaproteobacteria bacterium]|nr:hypothetical protein [Alphaproteobacteria bacterium]